MRATEKLPRLSANTERTYDDGVKAWERWRAARGYLPVWPPTRGMVDDFERDPSVGNERTRRLRVAAVKAHCRAMGVPFPKRIAPRPDETTPVKQSRPIMPADLDAMEAALGNGPSARRNAAILRCGFDIAGRREELAHLTMRDVRVAEGRYTLILRDTKNRDPWKLRPIGARASAALGAWLLVRGDAPGYVFGIKGAQINRQVRRMAKRIGLTGVTSHGMRAGWITFAIQQGMGRRKIAEWARLNEKELALYFRQDDGPHVETP